MSQSRPDPLVGRVLDERYRIDTQIASGGMSSIYRGIDLRLHRSVAVKVLHTNYASESTVRQRFESEAIIAANIVHPNVVSIRDHAVSGSMVYLVMEYVRGRNLAEVIAERGRFTPRQTLSVLEKVCRGLAAAHEQGIVHRDMKPANVLLADTGEVKLIDFGLAREASAHTQSATLVATLSHVSPELVAGSPADARSDIYAVGIMIYQMLTGALPYANTSAAALMKHHLDSPMPLPSELLPELAPDLDELVRYCTEKDPENRPQHAGFLLDDIAQINATLSDEQLDLGADELGSVADLTPYATSMPTSVQQRLDEWQRYREEQRDPWWLQPHPASDNESNGAGAEDSDSSDALTTVLSDGSHDAATEVIGADQQHTTVIPSSEEPNESESTIVMPRDAHGQSNTSSASPESPARQSKAAAKREAKAWKKSAQVPTHRLQAPASAGRKVWISLLLVLSLALVAGAAWFFGRGPGTVLRIPSLTGMLQTQAVAQLDEAGIPVRVQEVYDDSVAVGRVVATSPDGGENIMRFQGVALEISRGPELFAVPELQGMTQHAGRDKLKDLGMTQLSERSEHSETVPAGQIISTQPEAGTQIPRKREITLVISDGPPPVPVPEVIGLSEQEAREKLTAQGLEPTRGDYRYSSEVPAGQVAEQSPATGELDRGQSVTLHLSKGPEYVQVPRVTGMEVDEAVRTLEDAGFTVKTRSVLGGMSHQVHMQTPMGSTAIKGSEITLYTL
ncbi:PASTA domain-containing protein [Glutamicibacter endophyticus]